MKVIDRKLIYTALYSGLTASLIYPLWTFLKLPATVSLLLHFAFGPLLVVAFVGIQKWVQLFKDSVTIRIGTLFGAISGVIYTCMIVVQASNVMWIKRQASMLDSSFKDELHRNLQSVFSVQLGLDIVWDIFITLATMLLGISIVGKSLFSTLYGWLAVFTGFFTLYLNLFTFPVPPREAGYIDLGPLVGAWFLGLTIYSFIDMKKHYGSYA
jgi:hypothetical protein